MELAEIADKLSLMPQGPIMVEIKISNQAKALPKNKW